MKNITFLFGAGASYNSMPLVNNFYERFKIFQSYFRRVSDTNFSKFVEDCDLFIDEVQAHLSFDTYFKKLFHRDENVKRFKGKKILLLYFIFEHLVPRPIYTELIFSTNGRSSKEFNVDPRYDALIAGLLEPVPGNCKFVTNVNFITWNYDLNLLTSLKNFHSTKNELYQFINEFNN